MLDNWLSKKQIWLLRGVAIIIFLIQVGAYLWSSYRATNICKLSQPHSQYCDLTVVRKLSGGLPTSSLLHLLTVGIAGRRGITCNGTSKACNGTSKCLIEVVISIVGLAYPVVVYR